MNEEREILLVIHVSFGCVSGGSESPFLREIKVERKRKRECVLMEFH